MEIYDTIFLVMMYGSMYVDKRADRGNHIEYHSF